VSVIVTDSLASSKRPQTSSRPCAISAAPRPGPRLELLREEEEAADDDDDEEELQASADSEHRSGRSIDETGAVMFRRRVSRNQKRWDADWVSGGVEEFLRGLWFCVRNRQYSRTRRSGRMGRRGRMLRGVVDGVDVLVVVSDDERMGSDVGSDSAVAVAVVVVIVVAAGDMGAPSTDFSSPEDVTVSDKDFPG
jgi:hypothetical protein